jgi:hypothetical protein
MGLKALSALFNEPLPSGYSVNPKMSSLGRKRGAALTAGSQRIALQALS